MLISPCSLRDSFPLCLLKCSKFTTNLNNLGLLLKTQGKDAEAEPMFRRALEIDEKAYGKDHPEIATDLNNLATLLKDQGKYAEAEPLYRRALEIYEQRLGNNHPDTITSRDNLTALLKKRR
ncbi:MAG: tetratricopeptide repeat protein [Chlorobiaceae bacterium]